MIEVTDKTQLTGTYQGYLWYSDRVFPDLVWNENITPDKLSDLPFVVEGQLFDEKNRVSIRITNLDGEYRIAKMIVPENYQDRTQDYYAGGKFAAFSPKQGSNFDLCLEFYTKYEERTDPIRPDFQVAVPLWTAFVGFSEVLKPTNP